MKKLTISLAAMALFFAGCQKPELVGLEADNLSFEATVEEFEGQTKTSLSSGNYVVWSADDRLAIFQGSSIADEYQIAEESAGTNSGVFKLAADNSEVNGDFNAGTELSCNVAFYPYSKGLNLTGDMEGKKASYVLSDVVLPAMQTYVANSFANGAFPMVAITSSMKDHDLMFKNVLGAVKLSLKGAQTVKSIKVEGPNGEKLSGAATVTAYSNNLNPAIQMSAGASSVVTLDCGDGVQLNESEATDFYLALPPVLFEKGFKVTITDAADQEYTKMSQENSVVLRSSILAMPTLTLGVEGGGDSGEEDEELVIPVSYVELNSTSLKLYEGNVAQLTATVGPKDATNKAVVWSSDDSGVATVDQTGFITAVSLGSTTINAVADGVLAQCTVTVFGSSVATADYVDEYGVNHGKGTAIGMAVWAPVNCGYHETDYQWGKLYQWGRKYGQGYDGDATTPTLSEGSVSLAEGNNESNANVFYYGYSDWLDPSDNTLWNSGTEESPVKTEYDPCPEGWRVPTYNELHELRKNRSSWTTNDKNQPGYWFSGASSYTETVPQVFFPAAGFRYFYDGDAYGRGISGYYWSSKPDFDDYAYHLYFDYGSAFMGYDYRAYGYSLRCVQQTTSVTIPVSSIELNKTSLKLYEGNVAQLTATVSPNDASDKTVTWTSENPAVATVDESGLVTAVAEGTTTIYAVAGRKQVSCVVTVRIPGDYIDEKGVNQGKGTLIGQVVWAPVNCGYHETDYKWGKLYQWGRKYGQGYDGDATTPTLSEGSVSLAEGNNESNANVFYYGSYDWVDSHDYSLWNSGTEESPVKTEYDPCPEGWRVPTYNELHELRKNRSSWTTNDKNQPGYWFSGASSYTETVPQVFFPAAGYRNFNDGDAYFRGNDGRYWSSEPDDGGHAYGLYFDDGYARMDYGSRAVGYSLRCVQD